MLKHETYFCGAGAGKCFLFHVYCTPTQHSIPSLIRIALVQQARGADATITTAATLSIPRLPFPCFLRRGTMTPVKTQASAQQMGSPHLSRPATFILQLQPRISTLILRVPPRLNSILQIPTATMFIPPALACATPDTAGPPQRDRATSPATVSTPLTTSAPHSPTS